MEGTERCQLIWYGHGVDWQKIVFLNNPEVDNGEENEMWSTQKS